MNKFGMVALAAAAIVGAGWFVSTTRAEEERTIARSSLRYEYGTLRITSTSYPGLPARDVEMLWIVPGRVVQVNDRVNEPEFLLSARFFEWFCPGVEFKTRTDMDLISVIGGRGWRYVGRNEQKGATLVAGTGDVSGRQCTTQVREWMFERVCD